MRKKMTTSHEALTMYIFQPMLPRPMGMMKTKTSLVVCITLLEIFDFLSFFRVQRRFQFQKKMKMAEDFHLRKGVQGELGKGETVGADGVVHDLGRIQVQQRGPGDGVEALEEEHDGHVAVDQAVGRGVGVVGVHLGEPADDEQADDEEELGEQRGGLAAPLGDELGSEDGAEEAPHVQDDVLFTL